MWPALILIMKISVGSKKLLWPTIIGLFSVVHHQCDVILLSWTKTCHKVNFEFPSI